MCSEENKSDFFFMWIRKFACNSFHTSLTFRSAHMHDTGRYPWTIDYLFDEARLWSYSNGRKIVFRKGSVKYKGKTYVIKV